jgi:hypothetical protein
MRELVKRWDDRLRAECPATVQRYLDGRSELVIDFDVSDRIVGDSHRLNIGIRRYGPPTVPFPAWMNKADSFNGGEKQFVLVDNVQVVQGTQRFVPSVVRLKPLDDVYDIWSGAVYVSLFDHSIKVCRPVTEWEFDPLRTLSLMEHQSNDEVIQGRSKVMNRIAGDCGDHQRAALNLPDPPSVLSAVVITIQDDSVRLSVKKGSEFVVKLRDVALGPLHF